MHVRVCVCVCMHYIVAFNSLSLRSCKCIQVRGFKCIQVRGFKCIQVRGFSGHTLLKLTSYTHMHTHLYMACSHAYTHTLRHGVLTCIHTHTHSWCAHIYCLSMQLLSGGLHSQCVYIHTHMHTHTIIHGMHAQTQIHGVLTCIVCLCSFCPGGSIVNACPKGSQAPAKSDEVSMVHERNVHIHTYIDTHTHIHQCMPQGILSSCEIRRSEYYL